MNNRLCCRLALMVLVPALAAIAFAPTASAVVKRLPHGKTVSYLPTPAKMRALRASGKVGPAGSPSKATATPQLTGPINHDSFFSNLDYNGGPVMPSSTNHLIFWSPGGASAYPTGYQSGLEQYWNDLHADNGGNQNTESVATQYNDTPGNFAHYNVSFDGSSVDTTAYPASDCGGGSSAPGTPCLTDAQIQAELQSFLTAHGLTKDLTHEYFVVLPRGVDSCFDSNPNDGCSADSNSPAYCAYHGNTPYTPGNPVIVYSIDPFVNDTTCQSGQWPNGPSDGLIDGGMSHEHLESVTDPIPNIAWTDFSTGEIGDKCVAFTPFQQYGAPLGGTGTSGDPFYNQVINGHHYYYQEEWSNQGAQCLQRFTFTGTEPTATFTVTPGSSPDTANVDATGSTASPSVFAYHWEFENPNIAGPDEDEQLVPQDSHTYGSGGTHTISLTVYAPDGTSIGTSKDVTFPVAAFNDGPSHPLVGQSVAFNGSASHSDNGAITKYEWDFGDGSTASGATLKTPSHAYTASGTHVVSLTTTDSAGFKDQILQEVSVFNPPTASFSVLTSSPLAGQPITFDGSPSRSQGASITNYSWTFGDGTSGTGVLPTHRYAAPGSYIVRLSITDNFGNHATSSPQTVVVDELPTAAFSVRTALPATGAPVQFDASASHDPDGSITSYSWNFGDGSGGGGATPTHSYRTTGAYTVSLTVRDNSGRTTTTTRQLNVVQASTISKLAITKDGRGRFFLGVKVTGAGVVNFGAKHVQLRKAGTAKFRVKPNGRRKLRETVTFVPVAGSTIHKTATLKVPR